jgi:signal transduction histidine kinase
MTHNCVAITMAASFADLDPSDPAIEHLREFWELTHDPDTGFETKLDRVLRTETAELELPYGFLTHVDPDSDTQTIEEARGSHDLLQPGESGPLSESYCRHTVRTDDGVFHVDDAREEGWTDDPAYQRFGLGTYLGATVELNDEPYGTLCFASSDPRDSRIAPGERMFVDMLATWVSRELSLRATTAELRQQTRQVEELASMVSHDLRNPLAVARGETELLSRSVEESLERIEASHQRLATIVDKLHLLARMDDPVSEPTLVDLADRVSDAWALVETGAATLATDLSGARIAVDPDRLQHLLENLFRNGVEHGGEAVTVEVGLTDAADGFYVADDGGGIPRDEQSRVFEPGYSLRPENTGYGLTIVHRVAEAHGWGVTLTESDTGGARFEFTGVELRFPDS